MRKWQDYSFSIKCSIKEFFLLFFIFSQAYISVCAQSEEYNKLNNLLDKVDKPSDWNNVPSEANVQESLPGPTPQVFNNSNNLANSANSANSSIGSTYGQYGQSGAIQALKHSVIWKNLSNLARNYPQMSGTLPSVPGANPFNLSPFGMLHYMWDDTTYVSAANPVTLYQTQNELTKASQYANLAEMASKRAHYASSLEERNEAAAKAVYYANLAKQEAAEAKQVSESGSLNPADVAAAANEQANLAASYANNASSYAQRGF